MSAGMPVRGLRTRNTVPTVPERLRPWSVPWAEYAPVDVTPTELRADGTLAVSVAEGWAEPETDPTGIDFTDRQAAALVPFTVVDGRPRNPVGRTGRTGRDLGRWGENQAADPIVVAGDTERHVLLIRRADCGQWAIPGGMVEPGELALSAAVRELAEETGVNLTGSTGEVVSRGYVNDPRATDEAWVCSTVVLYRVHAQIEATAADDATDAHWWPLNSIEGLRQAIGDAGGRLYETHAPLLAAADTASRETK